MGKGDQRCFDEESAGRGCFPVGVLVFIGLLYLMNWGYAPKKEG